MKLWCWICGDANFKRNWQAAACQIMEQYEEVPSSYEEIRSLKRNRKLYCGSDRTIAFITFRNPQRFGNVLRVVSRLTADEGDIKRRGRKIKSRRMIKEIIPKDARGFNQGLIELSDRLCSERRAEMRLSVEALCKAHMKTGNGFGEEKGESKKPEKRGRCLFFGDNEKVAIRKRPQKGLSSGMQGISECGRHPRTEEVIGYADGRLTRHVKRIGTATYFQPCRMAYDRI